MLETWAEVLVWTEVCPEMTGEFVFVVLSGHVQRMQGEGAGELTGRQRKQQEDVPVRFERANRKEKV